MPKKAAVSNKVKRFPCKNHPKRKTTRKCYSCKSPICSDCIIRHDHHLFCSKECIRSYQDKTKKTRRKKGIQLPDILFTAFLLFLLAFLVNKYNYISSPLPSEASAQSEPDSLWKPLVQSIGIDYQLEGEFPPQSVVTVWINGQFFQTLSRPAHVTIPSSLLQPGENSIIFTVNSPYHSYITYQGKLIVAEPAVKDRNYSSLPLKGKFIALTFDAGSNAGAVDSIIQILARHEVRATAFLTGQFIRQFPDKVRALVQSGLFDFGNHSFSHPHLTTYAENRVHHTLPSVTKDFLIRELSRTDSLFFELTSRHLEKFWRAPYGEYNEEIVRWAAFEGYRHIGWTSGFDTFDWVKDTASTLYFTPEQLFELYRNRFFQQPERFHGAIILMHLGNDRQKPLYSFLDRFIPFMKKQGFRFVTIREALYNPPQIVYQKK